MVGNVKIAKMFLLLEMSVCRLFDSRNRKSLKFIWVILLWKCYTNFYHNVSILVLGKYPLDFIEF